MGARNPRIAPVGALQRSLTVGATLLAAVGLTVVSAPPAAAVDTMFYVAAGGSDLANTCAAAADPCATVSYALTQLPATTDPVTIKVSGTIADQFTVPARTLTITGDGAAANPVLDGSSVGTVVKNDTGAVLHLDHLTIQHGSNPSGIGGGAVYFNTGTLSLSQVTVSNSTANLSGGGIAAVNATVTIASSVISGNTTGLCGGCANMFGGGGIWAGSATVMSIENSTISGNTSQGGGGGSGGGVSSDGAGSSVTITGSTISGNTATSRGGGLDVHQTANITNSTISGNTAAIIGGGVSVAAGGAATMTASTLANNTGQNFGGGGVVVDGGTLTTGASILAGNFGGNCTLLNGGAVVSVGYNLGSDASCGLTATGDLSDLAANLGGLASNGGPTLTMLPATGSPVIGKIPSGTTLNSVSVCPRVDQRGAAGPAAGQTQCSIGSTEAGAGIPPAFTSAASTSVSSGTPFTFPVTTSSNVPPVLSVSPSTPLPAGVTFTDDGDGNGTLAGTASEGSYTFTLQANNGVAPSATQSFTLTVVTKQAQAALTVTSLTGTFGGPLTLTSSGGSGTGAVTYSVTNGTAAGCAISGSPPYQLSSTRAGSCTVTAHKAGDNDYNAASSDPTAVTVLYAMAAFTSPTTTRLTRQGSVLKVRFTLTDANALPISDSLASALAAAGGVKATLSGPGLAGPQLASAPCSWNARKHVLECDVRTPTGLGGGTSTTYYLTALEDVGTGWTAVPAVGTGINPLPIQFKP